MTYNERTVTLKLKRIEVCNLLLACTALAEGENRKHWEELHDKLFSILDEYDNAHKDLLN